jgi:hypothetical protein
MGSSPRTRGPGIRTAILFVLLVPFAVPAAVTAEDEGGGGAPAAKAPAPGVPLEERVNRAIAAGLAWLRKDQREDGSFAYRLSDMGIPIPGRKPMDQQWAGGPWQTGANALAVYALAACDVPRDDATLAKGLRKVREDWRSRGNPRGPLDALTSADGISTYYVSLALMGLDSLHNRGVAPMGKGPPGGEKGKALKRAVPVPTADLAWAAEMVEWLRLAQDPGKDRKKPPPSQPVPTGDGPSRQDGGGFSYESNARPSGSHDHSCSQFAILGLKAASRLGVKVPEETWVRALRHFLAAQEPKGPMVPRVDAPDAGDPGPRKPGAEVVTVGAPREKDEARGWKYMCPNSLAAPKKGGPGGLGDLAEKATGAMTAGGVSSLVICRSELDGVPALAPALRRLTEKGIRDGLAWLSLHFEDAGVDLPQGLPPDVPKGATEDLPFGSSFDNLYYAYGLERACILGGVLRIGTHDWYREGAELLLKRQREDGAFLGRNQDNGNGTDLFDTCFALLFLKRAVFRIPDRRVATQASGFEDLFARYRAADPALRTAMVPGFVGLGKETIPKLLACMDDEDREARAAAHEILRATTGRDFGYDPGAPPEERSRAAAAWRAWWQEARERLVADPATGTFREGKE